MSKKTNARELGSRYYKKQAQSKNVFNKNFEKLIINILAIVVILFFLLYIKNKYFTKKNSVNDIPIDRVASLNVPENTFTTLFTLSKKYNYSFAEVVALYSLHNNFYEINDATPKPNEIEDDFFINYKEHKRKNKKNLKKYTNLFANVFEDIKTFPININTTDFSFMDTWGSNREYGGDRIHLGTDIMDKQNISGRINVVSMTDGVVENIGWNELGGYRVGISSVNNVYYYYAHLESLNENLKKGNEIKSGDILGAMGDTGYSKIVGTTGNFPVHLHIGISPETELTDEEFWINPYPFLKFINISY